MDLPIKVETVNNEFVVTEIATGKIICRCPSITGLTKCIIGLENVYARD